MSAETLVKYKIWVKHPKASTVPPYYVNWWANDRDSARREFLHHNPTRKIIKIEKADHA